MTNIVIDGSTLIYASYFVLANKMSWWMVYGVLRSVLEILETEQPDTLAIVWGSKTNKKNELFPQYRTERTVKIHFDEKQFNYLLQIFSSLGIPQLKLEGTEADQILAAYVNSLDECTIISDDKDFFQLLNSKKTMLGKKRGVVTAQFVQDKYNLKEASLFGDFQAFIGDSCDKIPRILSTKDAINLINIKGRLSTWWFSEPQDLTNIPKSVLVRLQDDAAQLQTNYTLVNLREEQLKDEYFIPTKPDLPFVKEKLISLGMKSLLLHFERFERLATIGGNYVRSRTGN